MKHWKEISIDQFTGPLELLWTMLKDKKLDIIKINILEIVDQYLTYIQEQQNLDIEIASEYLLIASQLIEMKAKTLIPKLDEDEDMGFQYDDLIYQLTQYDQIKSVTNFFLQQQNYYTKTLSKPKSKEKFRVALRRNQENQLYVDPLDMDMEEFAQIFKQIMLKAEMRLQGNNYEDDWFEIDGFTITTDVVSPEEIATMIIEKMKSNKTKEWDLQELLDSKIWNIKNLISTFLAILDLVRHQVATIQQIDHALKVRISPQALTDNTLLTLNFLKENIDE